MHGPLRLTGFFFGALPSTHDIPASTLHVSIFLHPRTLTDQTTLARHPLRLLLGIRGGKEYGTVVL
jgi:hypothetical protein